MSSPPSRCSGGRGAEDGAVHVRSREPGTEGATFVKRAASCGDLFLLTGLHTTSSPSDLALTRREGVLWKATLLSRGDDTITGDRTV